MKPGWLRRPQTTPVVDPAAEDDITLAYRLILKRDPDSDGYAHYRERVRQGLTLETLLRELMASDERNDRVRRHVPRETGPAVQSPSPDDETGRIDPADVIRRVPLAELLRSADGYYRRIDDPLPLMRKPFGFLQETPEMLENLGALLGGLHLGKTMTVLDFGAGTCWLSRILAELNCQAICCEPSAAALAIGRRLFETHPPIGRDVLPPIFLPFDGHRIEVDSATVDRIICFDTFHHVPNQAEVLNEFARVLRSGGIAGFSEPGRQHSRSPQSQYEMRNHRVLENDIDLVAIFEQGQASGFTDMNVRVLCDLTVPLATYQQAFIEPAPDSMKRDVWNAVYNTMFNRSVFFLHKGPLRPDSRSHIGLRHTIATPTPEIALSRHAAELRLSFAIRNTGTARWLARNIGNYGIVRLASHLYDAHGHLVEIDYSRHDLPFDVMPGATLDLAADVPAPNLPSFRLVFDLVAEGVRWFENEGSQPVEITVTRLEL